MVLKPQNKHKIEVDLCLFKLCCLGKSLAFSSVNFFIADSLLNLILNLNQLG